MENDNLCHLPSGVSLATRSKTATSPMQRGTGPGSQEVPFSPANLLNAGARICLFIFETLKNRKEAL